MDANKLFCFTDPMGKSRPDTYDYDAGARRPCQQGARQDCPASWSDSPANHYAYDAGGHAEGNGGSSYDCQDRQAAVVAHYEYDPFGRTTVASGPFADANPWRFSTKQLDQAWGLYYYGLRYYSATLSRWINRDPIAERGGQNLYCCVRNSPVGKVDPLGQFDEWVEDIAPLDEQPVNDSTGNPLDGTSRFMASDVVGCICVGDTFSRMKIHCTLGARPSTRYTPDFFSDENRGILVRTHEWNHYEVWTEHYLPSYRDLFSRFAGDECCNCLERAAEFTALWRQLKDKLLRWERYQEYGDLRGPHRQPRFDYGTGYGSLSSIVNEVAAGIKTSCK